MEIRVARKAIATGRLTGLLQTGVACPARIPTTVTEFVTVQLGWGDAYLRDRISTVFLDGKVVDEPDQALLRDGSVLSLSAAMPGLVGATLRRGGYYAAMRAEISWIPGSDAVPLPGEASGTVRVRLFNLILRERADSLLERGFVLDREELALLLGEPWCAQRRLPAGSSHLVRVVDEPEDGPGVEVVCA